MTYTTDSRKEAVQELKTKQAVLERQIGHLQGQKQETDTIIRPSESQIEEFCKAAQFVMNNQLSFTGKQVIMRKAIDTIIAKQRELRIRGYLSIQEVNYVKSWSEYLY